ATYAVHAAADELPALLGLLQFGEGRLLGHGGKPLGAGQGAGGDAAVEVPALVLADAEEPLAERAARLLLVGRQRADEFDQHVLDEIRRVGFLKALSSRPLG